MQNICKRYIVNQQYFALIKIINYKMLKQPILAELKHFIHNIDKFRGNTNNVATTHLVRSSLNLLEHLPAAREVIFEYFSLVFDVSVGNFMSKVSTDSSSVATNDDEFIQDIQETLENLITKGPPAWSPLIANWSLELVGKLSNKYSPKKLDIGAACNLWLDCEAIRCLLGLIASSFKKMNNSEAEVCVETILGTFQKYSPTFDWVVARLGGCFPLKIISQILQCGLKKYCEDYCCNFDSEIGILDFLSFAHEKDLKMSLKELLEDGLNPKNKFHIQIIPYLLQLALNSEIILQVAVEEFLCLYNEANLEMIIRHTPIWMQNPTFKDIQPSMDNIVLKIKTNSAKIMMIIAQLTEKYSWCNDFLECTMQELEDVVYLSHSCPLLVELSKGEERAVLWKSTKSSIFIEQQTAVRLILLVSSQYPHVYNQTLADMLATNYDDENNGLGPLIRLIGGLNGLNNYPTIRLGLDMTLERTLLKLQFHTTEQLEECYHVVKNLYTLSKLENSSPGPYLKYHTIKESLNESIIIVLKILENILDRHKKQEINKPITSSIPDNSKRIKLEKDEKMDVDEDDDAIDEPEENIEHLEHKPYTLSKMAHIMIKLLNIIEVGNKNQLLGMNEILKLSYLSVKYFFMTLSEKSLYIRCDAINEVFQLFERQCTARKAARAVCLKELLEGALYTYSYLFGALKNQCDEIEKFKIDDSEKLISLNRKHGHGASANRSTLHAGQIGSGLKAENDDIADSPDPDHQMHFLKALDACCVENEKVANDGYVQISLILVELVSSDVMYNGLPFPEEEFTKVTIERDLTIRRAFQGHPILWATLSLIAMHRPALCYSSVLLRGLCASCLHQWRAKNVDKFQKPFSNDELYNTTCKLLEVLAVGQLIPHPISNLHLIIEHLDAPEVALVLRECVWNYLKDNVPSPNLFQTDSNGLTWKDPNLNKPAEQYVDTLRNIMQKKLVKLGAYYHQMFVLEELENDETDDEATTSEVVE